MNYSLKDLLDVPKLNFENIELSDVIDVPVFQELMDYYFALTGFAFGILDLKGKALVGQGEQVLFYGEG